MHIIWTVLIILVISALFVAVCKRIKVPFVLAMLVAGLVIGVQKVQDMIIDPHSSTILALGDIGLLCLMFIVGFESSWKTIRKESKDAMYVAFFASITPFLLGFIVFRMLGYSNFTAAIVGVCMSITAEATTAGVLAEVGKLRTKVGSLIVDAGLFDDVMGFTLFLIAAYIFKEIYVKEDVLFALAIVMFFLGLILQGKINKKSKVLRQTKHVMMYGIVPFFFIATGFYFDFNSVILNPWLVVIVLIIAVIGKVFGTLISKPFVSLKLAQLRVVGWAMNSRGEIELSLAIIAFRSGILSPALYSSLVMMAMITALVFPIVLAIIVKKNLKILD